MYRHLAFLLFIFFTICAPTRAEEEMVDPNGYPIKSITKLDKPPVYAWKLRLAPLIGGIVSSVNASRFDHGVGLDFEKWMTTTSSVSAALMHSRITVGISDKDAAGVIDQTYYEEWQFGAYYTMYGSPFFLKPRSFTRIGVYLVMPSEERPGFNPGDSVRLTNHGTKTFGARVALDYGFAIKLGESKEVELALGFSLYFVNPYNADLKRGNYNPNYLRSSAFGIADFCPTLTMNFGWVTF